MPSWSANSCSTAREDGIASTMKNTYLGNAVFHDLLASQVGLIAYKQLVNALRSVSVDLLEPLLDVRESVCRMKR